MTNLRQVLFFCDKRNETLPVVVVLVFWECRAKADQGKEQVLSHVQQVIVVEKSVGRVFR